MHNCCLDNNSAELTHYVLGIPNQQLPYVDNPDMLVKDIDLLEKRYNVVYLIPHNCGCTYIEETKRALEITAAWLITGHQHAHL